MNESGNSLTEIDAALERFSHVTVPTEIERRLAARIREFCENPRSGPATSQPHPAPRGRLAQATLVAGLAAMVAAAFFMIIGQQDAWAQVEKALRSKPWVRWTVRLPADVKVPAGFQPPEMWFSAEKKIFAGRMGDSIHFVNLASQESYDYLPQNKTIARSLTSDFESVEAEHFETLFRLLAEGDRAKAPADSPIQILGRSSRTIQDGTKRWSESTFKCRDSRRKETDYDVTFRIDPATQVPVEMRSTEKIFPADKTAERVYAIDYPEKGPVDVYALGAPADAQVVDRRRAKVRTSPVIKEFLAAYVKGRQKPIERFAATVLMTAPQKNFADIMAAYKAHDDRKQLVFEQIAQKELWELRRKIRTKEISAPNDEHPELWWKEQIADMPSAAAPPIDEYLPHRVGYPRELMTFGASPVDNPDCRVSLDWKPTTGPAETVLLRITTETTVGYNDSFFWIAPDRDFLVRRHEIHYSKDHAAWNNSTQIVDRVEKSPGGRWYATAVRSGRIEKHGADLPDALVPAKLEADSQTGPVTTSSYRFVVEFD